MTARYNADGTPDLSFNGTGWAINPVPSWEGPGDYVGVALQPDGKLVCVGRMRTALNEPTNILVTRYLTDGTLDPDLGTGGYLLLPPPNDGIWRARDVLITPEGKILICGFAEIDPDNDNDLLVIQLQANGAYDTAFGIGGVVVLHPGDPQWDFEAFDMALQSDGRIVLATEGRVDDLDFVPIWGCRLMPDGALDLSFGDNGLVINSLEGYAAENVVIGPNDEVFLAGYGNVLGNSMDMITMRLDANGQNAVDSYYECGPEETLTSQGAWFQADGGVITLGLTDGDAYLMRWLPDGTMDPTFGNNGFVTETTIHIDPLNFSGELWVEDDGRMLVCARSSVVPGNGGDAILMAFYPSAVGIAEAGSFAAVQVAPVPAQDQITLFVDPSLIGEAVMVELFNVTGAQVLTHALPALAQHTILTIPAQLDNGAYILVIRTKSTATRPVRVIVQR